MPLKPIYEKAPLKALETLPLRPGQASVRYEALERLLSLAIQEEKVEEQPALWEGIFRASCAAGQRGENLPVSGWIANALEAQAETGELPGRSIEESVAVMRAAYALYEYDAKRAVLEKLLKWCGFVAANLNEMLENTAAVRQCSAELMELLEQLYRVTGKKALLGLCEKLRRQCMDWSGILHTFAVQRPMSRVTPWADMEAGLEAEAGSEQGFYTREYLTCHGEHLADGARGAVLNGLYSGNGMELSAAQVGWEKITRYHGAVCGGVTCDGMIGGASPSACVDAAALGAWAEALCVASAAGDGLWALEALDIMAANAIPKAVHGGELHCLQRVNGLSDECGLYGVYHAEPDRRIRGLNRLLRGCAAICSHAVTMRRGGLDVQLYLPGKYTAATENGTISLEVSAEAGKVTLTASVRQETGASLRLRIPAWAGHVQVLVNGEAVKAVPGKLLLLDRVWHKDDVVSCTFERTLRILPGHHQSACVMLGNILMLMPASAAASWAVAMMGEPVMGEDGTVRCPVASVPDWRRHGDIPADLPVLPKVQGESWEAELRPYAEETGIALFPKGTRA